MKKVKQIHGKRKKGEQKISPTQAAEFLEDYRLLLHGQESSSKLISIRVPENLLRSFRWEAEQRGFKYQSQILRLMREWVLALTPPNSK